MYQTRVMTVVTVLVLSVPLLYLIPPNQPAQPASRKPTKKDFTLGQEQGSAFARLAFKGIQKEYPNHPGHVLNDALDVKTPRRTASGLLRVLRLALVGSRPLDAGAVEKVS